MMKPLAPPSLLRTLASAPRAYLFTHSRGSNVTNVRHFSVASPRKALPPRNSPSPPRLPKEEQEIFESLQRASTGAFSTPRTPPQINQSPNSSVSEAADAQSTIDIRVSKIQSSETSGGNPESFEVKEMFDNVIEADGKGEELHPNVMRGAQPEFEGDVNPKTGEVGGPKNEPLPWGPASEWTYNGRATDF